MRLYKPTLSLVDRLLLAALFLLTVFTGFLCRVSSPFSIHGLRGV